MLNSDYDVIICGAGPSGLILALTLTLCDKPAKLLLLNKRLTRGTHSRAFIVWPRNTESLYRLSPDLFRRMQASVKHSSLVQVAFAPNVMTGSPIAAATNPDELSPANVPWILPQYVTESILEQFLLERLPPGSAYATGWRLASLRNGVSNVSVLLKNDTSGDTHAVSCRYLVGCDGVRSAVRDMAGIPVIKKPGIFFGWLADVKFERKNSAMETRETSPLVPPAMPKHTPHTPTWEDSVLDNVTIFTPPARGWLATVPIDDSTHRVIIPCPRVVHDTPTQTETVYDVHDFAADQKVVGNLVPKAKAGAHIEAYIRDVTSYYGLNVREVVLASEFPFTFGLVLSYYKDNVVLAGDAAHQHSAAGGQGMNLGMQDAFDLGWRLQLLLAFKECEGVKDLQSSLFYSYEAERRPVAQAVIKRTFRLSARVMERIGEEKEKQVCGVTRYFPNLVALLMIVKYYVLAATVYFMFPIVFPRYFRRGMQLHFNYCKSPVTHSDTSVWRHTGIKPGVSLTSSTVIINADHPTARRIKNITSGLIVAELTSLFVFKSFCIIYYPSQGVLKGLNSLVSCDAEVDESLKQIDSEWSDFLIACDTRLVSHIVVVCERSSCIKCLKNDTLCVQYVQDVDSRHKYTGGSSKSVLLVIRPDGFVGYKGEPFRSRLVVQYLSQFVPTV